MKSFKKTSKSNNFHSKIKKSKRNYLRTKKILKKNKKGGMDPQPQPVSVVKKLTLQEKRKGLGLSLSLKPVEKKQIQASPSLEKLKDIINNFKYIFVFDFDCTLSTTHSEGNPKNDVEYLDVEQFENVNKIFQKIKENEGLIIILSRSIENQLKNNRQLLKLIPEEFILGAEKIEEVSEEHIYWAEKKQITLQEIYNFTDKSKEPIIMFYDDTEFNIRFAKNLQFIQSFNVPTQCEVKNKGKLLDIFNESVKKIPQFCIS